MGSRVCLVGGWGANTKDEQGHHVSVRATVTTIRVHGWAAIIALASRKLDAGKSVRNCDKLAVRIGEVDFHLLTGPLE
jgi:hypothetical protein